MNIYVYFDKDGGFLTNLVRGSQKGYEVKEWMKLLYQSADNRYLPKDEKVDTPQFPCIIVIHKSLFRRLEQGLDEHKKMMEKIQLLYSKLSSSEQGEELWQTYNNFLHSEIERVTELRGVVGCHQKELERHLQQQCCFFNNSSIWIRLVDWKQVEIDDAVNEMEYFNNIGLYNFESAKENWDYNIRIQIKNYLDSNAAGHGVHVTPILFGNETVALRDLKYNYVSIKKVSDNHSAQ